MPFGMNGCPRAKPNRRSVPTGNVGVVNKQAAVFVGVQDAAARTVARRGSTLSGAAPSDPATGIVFGGFALVLKTATAPNVVFEPARGSSGAATASRESRSTFGFSANVPAAPSVF